MPRKATPKAATPAVKKVRKAAKPAEPAPVAKTPAEPKKARSVFTFRGDPGSVVYLAGSFNNWDPQATKMVDKSGDGIYTVSVTLAPGIYEYKFVVNGVWTLDPDPDRDWTQNGLGTLNSVLRVG